MATKALDLTDYKYLWLLLAIGIIAYLLYAFGVFNPKSIFIFNNEKCIFTTQFNCMGYNIYSNGTLKLTILDNSNHPDIIYGIACNTEDKLSNYTKVSDHLSIGEEATLYAKCFGNQSTKPIAGDYYSGYMIIVFANPSDPSYIYTVDGEILKKVG